MGITISSKRCSQDLGGFGFNRFRVKVAEMAGEEIFVHYKKLNDAPFYLGREEFFKEYDKKTKQLVEDKKVSLEVANFLYQSDIQGKINRKQAKMIYELIKDCDDNFSYGYSGLKDCTTMKDMKALFNDKTKVEWC